MYFQALMNGLRVMRDVTPYTLTTLITDVGSMITALLGWLTSVMQTALSSPIVVAFIALAVAGVAIGFAKKLLHF